MTITQDLSKHFSQEFDPETFALKLPSSLKTLQNLGSHYELHHTEHI